MVNDEDSSNNTLSPCSPHRIEFLDRPNKRVCSKQISSSPTRYSSNTAFIAPSTLESVNIPGEISLEEYCQRLKSRNELQRSKKEQEFIFSVEDVQQILQFALERQSIVLGEQYDRVLQEKLKEQFHTFTKFTDDYISRQIKNSDFSYMS